MSLIYRCTIECGRDWASLTIAQSKHITCATARQARYAKYCTAKKVHRAQSPYAQKRIRTKHPLDSQGKRIVYLEGRIRPSTTTMRIFFSPEHAHTHTFTHSMPICIFMHLRNRADLTHLCHIATRWRIRSEMDMHALKEIWTLNGKSVHMQILFCLQNNPECVYALCRCFKLLSKQAEWVCYANS